MTEKLTVLANQVRYLLAASPAGLTLEHLTQRTHMGGADEVAALTLALSELADRDLIRHDDGSNYYTLCNTPANHMLLRQYADSTETALENSIASISQTLDRYLRDVGDEQITEPLIAARERARAALEHYRNNH